MKYVIRLGGGGYFDGGGVLCLPARRFLHDEVSEHRIPDRADGFDGERRKAAFSPAGGRTPLSLFLNQQHMSLKEGLIGGVLSVAWPLGRMEQHNRSSSIGA